jgi:hypothetical protein
MRLWKMLTSLVASVLCLSAILAQAARGDDYVDTMDVIEDASAQAQYRSLEREARAAFRQAMAACRKMEVSAPVDCAREARSNLQSDLTEAKKTTSTSL